MIEQEPFCAKHSLTMLLVLNAAALSLDFVFWVRAINTMKGFDWFVSQVLYPVSVASVLCPIVLGMKALGQISPRDTGFPLKYFFMLACLGTAQNWGLTVGGTLISGPMQIILGKAGAPVVMLQSWLVLGVLYRWSHVLAAFLMVLAGAISVIPKLGHTPGDQEHSAGQMLMGTALFALVMVVPKRVYEEKYTKEADLNPVYVRACESIMQVGIGAILLPAAFIQVSASQPPPSPSHIGEYLTAACGCLAGYKQSEYPEATCEGSWPIWLLFLACNLTHDVCGIAIAKHGSASLESLWSSSSFVVTLLLMQWPWLSGQPDQTGLSGYQCATVGVVLIGLVLYGWRPEIRPAPEPGAESTHEAEAGDKGAYAEALLEDGCESGHGKVYPEESGERAPNEPQHDECFM